MVTRCSALIGIWMRCQVRRRRCERGASGRLSNGVDSRSAMTAKPTQPSGFGSSGSGGVGSRDGFASRRSPVRSRYAPLPSKCRFCRASVALVALLRNTGASTVRADLGRQGARRRQVRSTEVRPSRVKSSQTPRSGTPRVTSSTQIAAPWPEVHCGEGVSYCSGAVSLRRTKYGATSRVRAATR